MPTTQRPTGCVRRRRGRARCRAALTEAVAVTSAPVVINFAIPGTGVHRIALSQRLPLVDNGTAGITIDGFSQPGSSPNTDPLVDNAVRTIELVGNGANGIEGLVVLGSHNVIRGLVMHRFKRAIRFSGKPATANQVIGNMLGLNPDGTLRLDVRDHRRLTVHRHQQRRRAEPDRDARRRQPQRDLRLLREGRHALQPLHLEELHPEQPDRPRPDRPGRIAATG